MKEFYENLPIERKCILLGILYNIDVSLCKEMIRNDFETLKENIYFLILFLPHNFLEKNGIQCKDLNCEIVRHNTFKFYKQQRKLAVSDDLFSWGYFYSLYMKKNTFSKQNLDKLDPLLLFSIGVDIGYNFFDLGNENEVDILKMIIRFKRINECLYEKIQYYDQETICSMVNKNCKLFEFIVEKDFKTSKEIFTKVKLPPKSREVFLEKLEDIEYTKYADYITPGFIIKNIKKFNLKDLIGTIDHVILWEGLKVFSQEERYKKYSCLETNEEMVGVVRSILKVLVKSNVEKKGTEMSIIAKISPISVISEIVDQIVVFPVLIENIKACFAYCSNLSIDVFSYYILEYMMNRQDYINENVFSKWFVSIVKLLDYDFEKDGLHSLILRMIDNKIFACGLLIKNLKTIPGRIMNIIKSAHSEVLKISNLSLKIRMEMSDIFSEITNRTVRVYLNIKNIGFLTLYDVKYICKSQKYGHNIECIVDSLVIKENNYFFLRNLALICGAYFESLHDRIEKLKEYFCFFINHEQEDIKIIANSIISNISNYLKDKNLIKDDKENNKDVKEAKKDFVKKGKRQYKNVIKYYEVELEEGEMFSVSKKTSVVSIEKEEKQKIANEIKTTSIKPNNTSKENNNKNVLDNKKPIEGTKTLPVPPHQYNDLNKPITTRPQEYSDYNKPNLYYSQQYDDYYRPNSTRSQHYNVNDGGWLNYPQQYNRQNSAYPHCYSDYDRVDSNHQQQYNNYNIQTPAYTQQYNDYRTNSPYPQHSNVYIRPNTSCPQQRLNQSTHTNWSSGSHSSYNVDQTRYNNSSIDHYYGHYRENLDGGYNRSPQNNTYHQQMGNHNYRDFSYHNYSDDYRNIHGRPTDGYSQYRNHEYQGKRKYDAEEDYRNEAARRFHR